MKLKKHILLFTTLLTVLFVQSQNQANNWYFGENAGINFSGGAPSALMYGQINTLEGCSAISSSDGELLFYSDGSTVWDNTPSVFLGNDTILQNGSELLLDAYFPDATYLWQDSSSNPYFLVTEEGFYYVIVTGNCGFDMDSINIDFGNFNCEAYVPNAFTPDGDHKNDVFIPILECDIIEYKLNIFNRWGQLVFSTTD